MQLRSRLGRMRLRSTALFVLATVPVGLAVQASTRSWLLGLLAGSLAGGWVLRRPARIRAAAVAELHEAWPDGVRQILASVRSGATIESALIDLAQSGPEPLREAWARFPALTAALGPESAMSAVRAAMDDPTTDRVVEVLVVAHRVGGRVVPEILSDVAEAVRADLRTLEEIRTAALEQRLNARIVFVVPWGLLALLTSRAGAYRTFYQSRPGLLIIGVAAAMSIAGFAIVSRLGREPIEPRVLGSVRGMGPR